MSNQPIRFGLVVPDRPPKENISQWRIMLDAVVPTLQPVIDSLWMTDHFFWEADPTYEAWTVMTYLVTRFPEFTVGSIVLGQSYRNPALLAKMASTLQSLSDGRVFLGIGAGWKEDEYQAYGYTYPEPIVRVEQLEDTLEIMTRLWNEAGQVSYQGKHHHISNAYCEPKPDPMIPILVGGGGRKTMMLAARFADEWNMPDCNIEHYNKRHAILKQHCESIGRDFDTMTVSWFGRLSIGDSYEQALARSEGQWHRDNALVGTIDEVKAQIQSFVDVGVTRFMVDILDLADDAVHEQVLGDLLPSFQ